MKKNNKSATIMLIGIVLLAGVFVFLNKNKGKTADAQSASKSTFPPKSEVGLLELPKLMADRPEQIIEHTGYTVSYNSDWCVPNWVAYELTREETRGKHPRAVHFEPDPDVRGVCPTYRDYSRSNYTRGHMAPAGDMKWDTIAMRESFYLSNVCPQDHNLNDGDWKMLEEQARVWAEQYGNLYIACGPLMSNNPEVIGRNNVAVPDAFFKVLLCRIDGKWQAIGFVFDNKPGHQRLRNYAKTIDEVERLAGIDFFPALEDDLENAVEAQYDLGAWKM